MSKLFSVYRTILYLVMVIWLIVTIGPMALGIHPSIVLSASMEPTIMTGALAYVDKHDTDVDTGDIVAYKLSDSVTVIHRVVEIDEKGQYVTKGDNNDDVDFSTVSPDQVIGTVRFSIPELGKVTSFLQSKKGIIVAVGAILIAFISSFLTDSAEQKLEKDNKNEGEEAKETSGNEAKAADMPKPTEITVVEAQPVTEEADVSTDNKEP